MVLNVYVYQELKVKVLYGSNIKPLSDEKAQDFKVHVCTVIFWVIIASKTAQ